MTDSWNIIGWIILGVAGLAVAFWVIGVVVTWSVHRVMHLRTRSDPPKPGDTWCQGSTEIHIRRIAENGRIVIQSGATSWSDSPEQWQTRVRDRKLRRISP
jgi:hypothetical protein